MGTLRHDPGRLLASRFEIESFAGSGGMADVYRARDREQGGVVALKLLHGDTEEGELVERFAREARILAELSHPGIVSYVAHGLTEDGQCYLAMEWLDGEDLGQRLQRGPLPLRDCLALVKRIADALQVAHARGVVHRDLKPSNLFLVQGQAHSVKLLDFGIARRVSTSRGLTRTGTVVGTPEYMAPEQARGLHDLRPAADMFSLGCVLYECLTGQPAFVAEHIAAVLVKILFEHPVPVAQRRLGVPPALLRCLDRLLAKEPQQRPPDAAALGAELLAIGELPAEDPRATMGGLPTPHTTFAESEQSLLSIVLAAPSAEQGSQSPKQAPSRKQLPSAQRLALIQALTSMGASPDFLANGALVVTVPPLGSAHDQATVAARAALIVKESWPQSAVSLATARGTIRGTKTVGEVVEQAAAMLHRESPSRPQAAPTGILIDPLSARLLTGRFAQLAQPEGALLLSEEKDLDVSRPLLGRPTPCVGREAELGTLEAQLAGCIDELTARAVIVTASPGAGKSRLRHEFLRRVERRGEPVTVLLGRGDRLSAGEAYGMVGRAIRMLCGVSGSESLAEQQDRLRLRIEKHLEPADRAQIVPFVGELCGIHFADEDYPLLRAARQTPKILPERIRRACLGWLAAECRAAAVVFVLDDLHWGDELTVGLFSEALRELRGASLLILALARPEVYTTFPALWEPHTPQKLVLKGLSRRACERLIQHTLGRQVSAEAIEWMVEHSGGNALFLEELIRATAEGPVQQRPETVIAMLQARIGQLGAGPRRAVLAAAVFGHTLWQGGVAKILGHAEDSLEVEGWLRALQAAEIIEAHGNSRILEQKEYGFRHALVRDAAYGLLTPVDLKLGHQLAAEFLELRAQASAGSEGPERPERDDQAAALAYHFQEAADFKKAVHYGLLAGSKAQRLGVFSEARRLYSHALEALEQITQTPEYQRHKVELLLRLVTVAVRAEPAERNLARLAAAQESLLALGETGAEDLHRKAWAQFLTGRVHHYLNNPLLAIAAYERAMPIAASADSKALLGLSMGMTGAALIQLGRAQEAAPMLGEATRLMDMRAEPIDSLLVCTYYAAALAAVGRGAEAVQQLARAHALARELNAANAMTATAAASCISYMWMQDWPLLLQTGQEVVELATRTNEVVYIFIGKSCIAWAEAHLGHFAVAEERRQSARDMARERGGRLGFGDWFDASDAMTAVLTGQYDAAIALARGRIAQSQADGMVYSWALAERAFGLALGYKGDDEGSAAHLRESERLFTAAGNQIELAHALYWRARLAHGQSRNDLALQLATDAQAEYARIHLENASKDCSALLAALILQK